VQLQLTLSKQETANTLRVPPEDFYQLIFEFPKKRFLHTPSFVGMHYTDDLIILDLTFIEGRSKETRLALLKDINTRVAAAARVSPDDLMITLYEAPRREFLLWPGRGAARQRRCARTKIACLLIFRFQQPFRCESDLHVRVLASGAFYLLRKPFEASALIACLRSVMAG
jgi:hypothetical protein